MGEEWSTTLLQPRSSAQATAKARSPRAAPCFRQAGRMYIFINRAIRPLRSPAVGGIS